MHFPKRSRRELVAMEIAGNIHVILLQSGGHREREGGEEQQQPLEE